MSAEGITGFNASAIVAVLRILLQRVTHASVTVDRQIVGAIDRGLVLLVGIGHNDNQAITDKMADKIVNLRIFCDDANKFNLSLLDIGAGALVISQFTLCADARKGRRPSFTEAARPEQASPLCDYFAHCLSQLGVRPVESGTFGAMMQVEIHNDGPVTIWLDSNHLLTQGQNK